MTSSITSRQNIRPVSCEMTGTYRGRSRHRLPRREGARSAGRTGGAPQYVPADMYPPATVFLRKRSRCHFLPSTCHGIPAKVFQVSLPAVHLPRNPRKSVSGVLSLLPTCHGNPAKACQVSHPPPTCHGSSSHHGMLGFFSRACGCFQHEACNHQHTCSCGIHVSF